jgi:hypothetical protein
MSLVTESTRLKVLKSAPLDRWIALSEDETRIVATGASYEEVSKKIEELGLPDAVVLKTPAQWAAYSV